MNFARAVFVLGALTFALAGCVSYPPPVQHLATSMASLRAAQEVGAAKVPQALLLVTLADEELKQAKAFMVEGKNERADYMTLRAYNDAELALALTREYLARMRAEKAAADERAAGIAPP